MRYLYIDFETGGLNPEQGHEALDLAAKLLENDKELTELSAFHTGVMNVRQIGAVQPDALAVNGITFAQIETGRDPVEAAEAFVAWLEACQIVGEGMINKVKLTGHNVQFDRRFMRAWLANAGLLHKFDELFHYSDMEVKSVAEAVLVLGSGELKKTSLYDCTKYFGIEHAAHTADGDVSAGVEVFRKLIQRLQPATAAKKSK